MPTLLINNRTLRMFCVALGLHSPLYLSAQALDDSTRHDLQPVDVKVYFMQQPRMGVTSTTQILTENNIRQQATASFTGVVNTVPGVRVEERSPGSYRLAMRGSMIRSPFGVRNTKIYIDEFPLTDAGGNTYLNLLDPFSIASIMINKGPDGSLYGANSGGVIRLDPKGFGTLSNKIEAQLTAGSFGLFQEQVSVQRRLGDRYQFSFDQSFTRADGYREQSAMRKKTFQTAHQWQYSNRNQLKLYVLYADLAYQTPGGLTAAQYADNPRSARIATAVAPGAKEQKAAIYNKTWVGALTHQSQLSEGLSHMVTLFGSTTDFENPFITNYEYRQEQNIGARTYFSLVRESYSPIRWQMQLGAESYWGGSDRKNYTNNAGVHGNMLDDDKLSNYQLNVFYRGMLQFWERWILEASIGYNKNTVRYEEVFPEIDHPRGRIEFDGIWMPRVASSFRVTEAFSLRASVAKGYSPPTMEEIRPSDRVINTELQAEVGTNIEAGLRYTHPSQRVLIDLAAYDYAMHSGIVRQLNGLGEDYYLNAGNMLQKGLELGIWSNLVQAQTATWIQQMTLHTALAYQYYRFGDYQVGDKDYTGNHITAVPGWTASNSLQLRFLKRFHYNILHQYRSTLPLDDANIVWADKYHLLQMKIGLDLPQYKGATFHLFVGGDNLLNEHYSLGNDINAFGGRYFNPAPSRNVYAGIRVSL